MQSIETGYRERSAAEAKPSAAKLATIHSQSYRQLKRQHVVASTALPFVYRSLRTINRFETFTLFSRVTLIRKPQSTPDLDHLHARPVPYSRVKSRDDLISGRRGDSGVQFSIIYIDNKRTAGVPSCYDDADVGDDSYCICCWRCLCDFQSLKSNLLDSRSSVTRR